jgi:hypothetical protein
MLAAALLAGCDAGPTVAFNQRVFRLPEMTPFGTMCMTVRLGDSGGGSGGGFGTENLIVGIRVAKEQLFVEVSEGRTVLVRRAYDEPFFRSQRVDEFRVTATTGTGMLLRNWGSYGPDGQPLCAPSEDDGSRPGP